MVGLVKRPPKFGVRKYERGFVGAMPLVAFVNPSLGLAGPRVTFVSGVKLWKYIVASWLRKYLFKLARSVRKLDEDTLNYTLYWWITEVASKLGVWSGGRSNQSDVMVSGDDFNAIRNNDTKHWWNPKLHVVDGWAEEANGEWIPRTYTRYSNGFIEAVHCPKCNWYHVWKFPASAMEYTRIREAHVKLCQPERGRPAINFRQGDGVPEPHARFRSWREDDGKMLRSFWSADSWEPSEVKLYDYERES